MATQTELLDPPTVMSYSGLVDASTVEGQVDETADWNGAIAAMLVISRRASADTPEERAVRAPAKHLRQIIRRRGAYPQPR